MNTRRDPVAPRLVAPLGAAAAVLLLFSAAFASQDDRDYRMGDDPAESASNNGVISVTYDSAGQTGESQLHDLVATGGPVYRSYTGRPDGNNSLGVELNGTNQFLRSARFGLPDTTVSSVQSTTLNYSGISNRGLQFWVRPGSAAGPQTMVMDTNQHGARIDSDGNFSMRYAGVDYDSTTAATAGTWYHVMVVRPNGPANGAQMYVNGIAATAAPGGYDGADTAELVVGANTAGDDGGEGGVGFTGGTEEFFSGVIDDLKLFVIGQSNEYDNVAPPVVEPAFDFGDFNFAADNDFAADLLSGVPGDLDNNGSFQAADRTAFINGWRNEQVINNVRVGDLNTFADGDLNFDGITDIRDLALFQTLLPTAGLSAITAAELSAVPEPSTAVLALLTLALTFSNRRHGRARRM